MKTFSIFGLLWIYFSVISCSRAQKPSQHIGGPCEGCESIYEYGNKSLTWVDTLPDFNDDGPRMVITGTIYKKDGKTPAPGVILYIYHTNQQGIYPKRGDETGWGTRHGYIRGWIKTGKSGQYKFYTLKPAAYPTWTDPAHIHPIVKEPDKNEYWIDEYIFEGDSLITEPHKSRLQNRGGSGICRLLILQDGTLECRRDIILGMNVPDYND